MDQSKAQELKQALDRAAREKIADRTHIFRYVLDAIIDELAPQGTPGEDAVRGGPVFYGISNIAHNLAIKECEERRVNGLMSLALHACNRQYLCGSKSVAFELEINAYRDRLVAESGRQSDD